jgi:hypothetical protein
MRNLLFTIDRLEFVGGGKALLAGRCCKDPIKKGDEAQFMILEAQDGRSEKSEPISLLFPEFEFYGKKIDELDSGHTAGIYIPIDVATGLRFGWLLKGKNA